MSAFVFVFFTLSPTFSAFLTDCENTFTPSSGDTIICDNRCVSCTVECNDDGQCKSPIYSAALTTSISCNGPNSCQDISIYIGIPNTYPTGYDIINFEREQFTSFSLACAGSVSCSKSNVFITGNFVSGGVINAAGGVGNDHFKDAYLEVAIRPDQTFNLNCGLDGETHCGGNTQYVCNGGWCQCNGIYGGTQEACSNLNSFVFNTLSPSDPPVTPDPTTSPIGQPTFPTRVPTFWTYEPVQQPTPKPSGATSPPTLRPTTLNPTGRPTKVPSPAPTDESVSPTIQTPSPTGIPSVNPTYIPTRNTNTPTLNTASPTSLSPTESPSKNPVQWTPYPSWFTDAPTEAFVTASPIPQTGSPSWVTYPPSDRTNYPSYWTYSPTEESRPTTSTIRPSTTTLTPSDSPTTTDIPTNPNGAGAGDASPYKPGYKAGIIVSTSIIALALVIVGIYYLYHNSRKKQESDEDVKALDSALPMSVPWKKNTQKQIKGNNNNIETKYKSTSDGTPVNEMSTNEEISDIKIVANDVDTAGIEELL